VYGKKVDDFHAIDKDKIFTVLYSATQELDKLVQIQQTKIQSIETQNTLLLEKMMELERRLIQLEGK
jgi:hypothetical protein